MIHARGDYNRIQDPKNKIGEDEPVFLLRAQDKTAAKVVRYWAAINSVDKVDREIVTKAINHAVAMEKWQKKNGCKKADL